MSTVIQDNNIRRAEYIGISDRKLGLFSFMVDLLGDSVWIRFECRLRGVIAKKIEEGDTDTYEVIHNKIRKSSNDECCEVTLQFLPKGNNPAVPWLVELYLKDGTHMNTWLLDGGFAKRFSGKELRDNREEREN